MRIERVHVINFRCIRDEPLLLENLTVLVGPNGSGKSSFLQALRIFYEPTAKLSEEDFYGRDTEREIAIRITFIDLTDHEKQLFSKYIRAEKLAVDKVIKWNAGKPEQKYYGSVLANPDFDSFRQAKGVDLRKEYEKLRESKYVDLLTYSNKDSAQEMLAKWEESHPEQCKEQQVETQFFGYRQVGERTIERYTRFIFVPAVRDASQDAADARGTPLTEIMDLLIRGILEQRAEIVDLRTQIEQQYKEIINAAKIDEFKTFAADLEKTLKLYVPDAGIQLDWQDKEIDIPMPQADIKLLEHGYPASVERCGHGLQRAFILTLLQHLVLAQSATQDDTKDEGIQNATSSQTAIKPCLIIGIEEPELYQHPCRQRHLSEIFQEITESNTDRSTGGDIQIICTTHSPLFIDIEHFDMIRLLRKVDNRKESNMPKRTEVTYTTLDDVAKQIEQVKRKETGSQNLGQLQSKILTIMTPTVNEGFFAHLAVLVEGESDRLAIITVAEHLGHSLNGMGVSVISCAGKENMGRPIAIFHNFGIPVYPIWDSDKHKSPGSNYRHNHELLRLCGQLGEDWPSKIERTFACFQNDLNSKLRAEIGELFYDDILSKCCESLQINKESPQVIRYIISEAYQQERKSQTLEDIVSQIVTQVQVPMS